MKKLLLLSAFLIFACSSDDSSDTNDNTSTNDGLIPKTINLYSNGELTSQSNYLYNENNLISITGSDYEFNSKINYTYNEEGMINKIEFDEYYNQELVGTFKFDYIYNSSNVLVEIISYQENYSDESSSIETFSIDYPQENEIHIFSDDENCTDILTVDNGNITSIDDCSSNQTRIINYDQKNSVFRNIKGNNIFSNYFVSPLMSTKNNNIVSVDGWELTYIYNEQDYPINITFKQCETCSIQRIEILYTN